LLINNRGERNLYVDIQRNDLVLKAFARSPDGDDNRAPTSVPDASHLRESNDEETAGATPSTVEVLLDRLRQNGDFPALGSTLSSINRIVSTETEHACVLTGAILKDVSMTNRLLRIVNAVAYRQFGGSISTVSRAIDILGFNTVRNLALSLTLIEHLHDRTQASALQEEIVACYVSGLAALELADKFRLRDPEQAFVCSMFRRLGRLLVLFFLNDEARAIEKLLTTQPFDEDRAARKVLGLGYEELGMAVAKAWNLPDTIVNAMQPAGERPTSLPASADQRIRLLAEVSNNLADALRSTDEKERGARFARLEHRYAALALGKDAMTGAINESMTGLLRDADALGIGKSSATLLAAAKTITRSPVANISATSDDAPSAEAPCAPVTALNALNERLDQSARHAKLVAGIQSITNALASDFNLDTILGTILETFFRAMPFARVLFFVVDPSRQSMRCRIGFGLDAEAFVKEAYTIPLDGMRTVFHAAAGLGNDLSIEDIEAEKIRAYIPDWYRKRMPARGMLLLPVSVGSKRIGMIYADVDDSAKLKIGAQELSLLKTLRNQAVLAIRQAS
jgi:eukaryotic-like serine/threonine-protein kinase